MATDTDVLSIADHIIGTTRFDPGERAFLMGQFEQLQRSQQDAEKYRKLAQRAVECGMRMERRAGTLVHALGTVKLRQGSMTTLQQNAREVLNAYRVNELADPDRFDKIKKEAGF